VGRTTEPKTVAEYLEDIPDPHRDALERLRETVLAVVPGATEALSYRIPTFKVRGKALLAYAAFKNHCSLFPMSMRVIEAHEGELAPFRASKGTIHFQPDRPLPRALITAIVRERVRELGQR
jgi:uncharacterized protein YdhG (YjbR/CyaY superfamily)